MADQPITGLLQANPQAFTQSAAMDPAQQVMAQMAQQQAQLAQAQMQYRANPQAFMQSAMDPAQQQARGMNNPVSSQQMQAAYQQAMAQMAQQRGMQWSGPPQNTQQAALNAGMQWSGGSLPNIQQAALNAGMNNPVSYQQMQAAYQPLANYNQQMNNQQPLGYNGPAYMQQASAPPPTSVQGPNANGMVPGYQYHPPMQQQPMPVGAQAMLGVRGIPRQMLGGPPQVTQQLPQQQPMQPNMSGGGMGGGSGGGFGSGWGR